MRTNQASDGAPSGVSESLYRCSCPTYVRPITYLVALANGVACLGDPTFLAGEPYHMFACCEREALEDCAAMSGQLVSDLRIVRKATSERARA